MNTDQLKNICNGIINGEIHYLSKAITLIESTKAEHQELAYNILEQLPKKNDSWRIAVTGVPGVGKSTLINSFGKLLIEKGFKVAVLSIDPSSEISGGSILGDKTRMEQLTKSDRAFIRPTASSGFLGGTASKTYETILLCEAAGFDIIFVETVGVGQSEIIVNDLTDCFLFLKVAGTGDSLQGIKRGIMEMADLIFINKWTQKNDDSIKKHLVELKQSLHLMKEKDSGWEPKIIKGSGLNSVGLEELHLNLEQYFSDLNQNQFIQNKRKIQKLKRLKSYVSEIAQIEVNAYFKNHIKNSTISENLYQEAQQIVNQFLGKEKPDTK